MGGFITDSTTEPFRVAKRVARWVPTTFRGIVMANADGSIPDVVMSAHGADLSNQWGGPSGTPGRIDRQLQPADIDRVDLYDQHGDLTHSFGAMAVDEGTTLTVPGSLLELGAWHLRNRLTIGSADADDVWELDQGDGTFVVVPYVAGVTLPAAGTPLAGRFGEVDAALWAALGWSARASIALHADEGGPVPPSAFRAGAKAVLDQLTAHWKNADPNRTRPGTATRRMRILSIPDYTLGDAAVLKAEIAHADYDQVDGVVATNEITPGNGHEGGNLSAANLALMQEFYTAVKEARPGWKVLSASSTRMTAVAISSINGFLAAAAATGSPNAPFFDVLAMHDYPGAYGSPGYADAYYGNLQDLNWAGLTPRPVFIDESVGNAGAQEGGGYDNRQARRVMWDLRTRCVIGGVPPEATCYFSGFGGFPWWVAHSSAPGVEPTPYQALGRLMVHRLARRLVSQLPEARLHHPDPDEDQLLTCALYRQTTAGAQPADTANPALVDLQTLGDPDATITLQIAGTVGATVPVWTGDGKTVTAAVTGGRVTLDRTLLGGDGLMDGAYLFLPAGCTATVVDIAPAPRIDGAGINIVSSAGSNATPITRVLRGPWINRLALDLGNRDEPGSIWRTADILDDPQRIEFHFRAGRTVLHQLKVVSAAPWQLQAALNAFTVIGLLAGDETELADITTVRKVLRWPSESRLSWHRSFDNDQHAWTITLDQPAVVDGFAIVATEATYGGSPTLDAATGFGRTTTVGKVDGAPDEDPPTSRNVATWTGPNLLGAGFAGPQRVSLHRVIAYGAPAVPIQGETRYLTAATGVVPAPAGLVTALVGETV